MIFGFMKNKMVILMMNKHNGENISVDEPFFSGPHIFWEASTSRNHCHSANSFVSDMSDRKILPETIILNAFLNQL